MSFRNVRQRIGDASALARYRVAQRVGLELQWEHQGAAPVSIWTDMDGNALSTVSFPDFGIADHEVNYLTVPNQPNLTFTPRSGDKVTMSGKVYFVTAQGVIGDFDSGFVVEVTRKTTIELGLPVG